ncbi:hypothetical protein C8Q80DRAFT_1184429 [Daedaleopsis nitida]|nr:hypothetical protein C8Q80DRAFT_1184429 [Daedaleopsis nitida]
MPSLWVAFCLQPSVVPVWLFRARTPPVSYAHRQTCMLGRDLCITLASPLTSGVRRMRASYVRTQPSPFAFVRLSPSRAPSPAASCSPPWRASCSRIKRIMNEHIHTHKYLRLHSVRGMLRADA